MTAREEIDSHISRATATKTYRGMIVGALMGLRVLADRIDGLTDRIDVLTDRIDALSVESAEVGANLADLVAQVTDLAKVAKKGARKK